MDWLQRGLRSSLRKPDLLLRVKFWCPGWFLLSVGKSVSAWHLMWLLHVPRDLCFCWDYAASHRVQGHCLICLRTWSPVCGSPVWNLIGRSSFDSVPHSPAACCTGCTGEAGFRNWRNVESDSQEESFDMTSASAHKNTFETSSSMRPPKLAFIILSW